MTGHTAQPNRMLRQRIFPGLDLPRPPRPDSQPAKGRNAWIDAAKGLCIILVVLFHSTLGVEKDIGALTWMHAVIDWAKPFRMPDFFLISGLFLGARIARPWRAYLDAKVWHFAYFYVLWFHIHFGLRLKALIADVGLNGAMRQYLEAYIDPFGSLWFIYLLAVFCIVAKLVRRQPAWLIAGIGLAAHVLAPHTGIFMLDEFLSRFVFFYLGFAYAPAILEYARQIGRLPLAWLVMALALWAVVNTLGLLTGLAELPGLELAFAGLGIAAVIAFSVAITRSSEGRESGTRLGAALAYCGRNSIVIYLAFTIFMAVTRTVLLKVGSGLGVPLDGGLVALAAAASGLIGALVLNWMVQGTRFAFLFVRPATLRFAQPARPVFGKRAVRA
jgi:uncharacterized membrane protein YcfT